MRRDYKPVEDKCYELINHYRVWVTRIGKNKKLSIFVCRPDDNKYINVGLLSDPELFIEMLKGKEEPSFRDTDVIVEQAKVRNDIYKFLKDIGMHPQDPENVAIITKDNIHHIFSYSFDKRSDHWGTWEHSISFQVRVDYSYEELEHIVRTKVAEEIK